MCDSVDMVYSLVVSLWHPDLLSTLSRVFSGFSPSVHASTYKDLMAEAVHAH